MWLDSANSPVMNLPSLPEFYLLLNRSLCKWNESVSVIFTIVRHDAKKGTNMQATEPQSCLNVKPDKCGCIHTCIYIHKTHMTWVSLSFMTRDCDRIWFQALLRNSSLTWGNTHLDKTVIWGQGLCLLHACILPNEIAWYELKFCHVINKLLIDLGYFNARKESQVGQCWGSTTITEQCFASFVFSCCNKYGKQSSYSTSSKHSRLQRATSLFGGYQYNICWYFIRAFFRHAEIWDRIHQHLFSDCQHKATAGRCEIFCSSQGTEDLTRESNKNCMVRHRLWSPCPAHISQRSSRLPLSQAACF